MVESVGLPAENKSAKERSEKVMKRLGHKNLELTEHEGQPWLEPGAYSTAADGSFLNRTEIIAAEVIHPDDIDVRFSGA